MPLPHLRLGESLFIGIAVALCVSVASVAGAQVTTDTTRRDTTRLARPRPDSAAKDSAAKKDSAVAKRDSAVRTDSTTARDSAVTRDSLARDSLATRDSVVARDSLMADTTATPDSARTADSTAIRDSAVAFDSAAARPARPAREPPIPASTVGREFAPERDIVPERSINAVVAPGRSRNDSIELARTIRAGLSMPAWRRPAPPRLPGAILPASRIVAFYGSSLSRRMGILGQVPPDSMLALLESVAKEWEAADPNTPVQKALHFIAVVAQAGPGSDRKYRLRMDSATIEQVYGWARRKNAILFLDIQAGHSSVMDELPKLARFLERPDVHLGIDPEFNMRFAPDTVAPGKWIGWLTANEINFAVDFLAGLAEAKNLPPKVLVIHRFRAPMVRNVRSIKLDPRVQIVMHMDGWGVPAVKFGSYLNYIVKEPVQFTGFKLFFRHDTQRGDKLLTPRELLQLWPRPLYIQYQ